MRQVNPTGQNITGHSNETWEFAHYLLKAVNSSLHDVSDRGAATSHAQHRLSIAETVGLVLGATSLLANAGVLLGLLQLEKKLSPNLRLILSLCFSDIMVSCCVILDSLNVTLWGSICMRMIVEALRTTSHIISLLNLSGLALDHYAAMVKPLLYPLVMSPNRACILIIMFWMLAFLGGFSDFYVPMAYSTHCKPSGGQCLPLHCSRYRSEYLMFAVTLLLFVIMACIYSRIFSVIRSHRKFQARYRRVSAGKKRGLLTTLLILATFTVCWLPYCLLEGLALTGAVSHLQATDKHLPLIIKLDEHLYNLLLLSCVCDPVIYATRMKDVRAGYHQLLTRVCVLPPDMRLQGYHSQLPLSTGSCRTSSSRCISMGQILVCTEDLQARTDL